jgi:hypothetical protein
MRREFVDERRRWERNLMKAAPRTEVWDEEVDAMAMDEDEMGEGPPDEIEDEEDVGLNDGGEGSGEVQDFSDEEYERIFAEIVMKEESGLEGSGHANGVIATSKTREAKEGGSDWSGNQPRQERCHDTDMADG